MEPSSRNIDSLFHAAIRIEDFDERARYLDVHCRDPRVRTEIERLLEAHEGSGSFLNQPPPSFDVTEQHDPVSGNRISVLKALGRAFGVNPSVSLHDAAELAEDPVQHLSSDELPRGDAGSRYQLFGEIARGGMGAIIKGRDTDLGRDLAVKVLLKKHRQRPEAIQRFVEEAQIGGQLQHPGIAPVYELGQFDDQRPYFTMKLVKGKTLAALLDARKTVEADRGKYLGIFKQVCQTMAYAHSRRVIHRDLKPANVMVGAFGEVQVMDWGLAKILSGGGIADEQRVHEMHQDRSIIETLRSSGSDTPAELSSQTQMGSVMGTPAYMPPEQALGEIDQLNQRTDVFGLGAILCEILTGKPPYVADDAVKVFRLASRGKLDECFQRLDDCNADQELIALVKECLSAEQVDRPCDASVLADRVSEYQQAVETRLREADVDRAAQKARAEEERKRRRVTSALALTVLTLVLAISGGGLWLQTQKAVAANEVAVAASRLAEKEQEKARLETEAKEELRWVLYRSDIRRAQTALEAGNYSAVKEILAQHIPQPGQRDLRGFEWHYLYRRCPVPQQSQVFQWEDDALWEWQYQVSGDGNRIAAIINDEDGNTPLIVVWSTKTGKREWSTHLDVPTDQPELRLNHDGTLVGLCTAGIAKRDQISVPIEIHIWDLTADQPIARITSQQIENLIDQPAWFEFRPGTTSIAIRTAPPRHQLPRDHSDLESPMPLLVWDFAREKMLLSLEFNPGKIEFSPDGSRMAVADLTYRRSGRTAIRILDAETGDEIQELPLPKDKFSDNCTFSPDGARVAMAAADGVLYSSREHVKRDVLLIWNVDSGALEVSSPSKYGYGEVTFSPSGEFLMLVPRLQKHAEVFRVSDGSPVIHVENPAGGLVQFSEDESAIRAIHHDGSLWSWRLPRHSFDRTQYAITGGASLSGDGKRILRTDGAWEFAEAQQSTASLFDIDGRFLRSIELPSIDEWAYWQLNHDGSIAVVERTAEGEAATTKTITMWKLDHNGEIVDLYRSTKNEELKQWYVSPSEAKVVGIVGVRSEEDETIVRDELRIWDQTTREEKRIQLAGQIPPGRFWHSRLAFSGDGKVLGVFTHPTPQDAAGTQQGLPIEGDLSVYDTATQKLLKKIKIPGNLILSAFSSDLQLVAGVNTVGEGDQVDERLEIWDLQTGKLQTVIDEADARCVFTQDGKRLVTFHYLYIFSANRHSDVFTVWDVETGAQLLTRTYYGGGGPLHFGILPGQERLVNLGYYGLPQIWDGTPVDVQP